MQEFVDKFNNQWAGIIGAFIAAISLVVSVKSNRRTTAMRNQQEQERLYKEMKYILESKNAKSRQAIDRLLNRSEIVTEYTADEDQIIRETNRYFGRICCRKFREIIGMYKETEECNYKLGVLFEALADSNPDTLIKLKEALKEEMEEKIVLLDASSRSEVVKKASIVFRDNDLNEVEMYDFREIYGRCLKLTEKINVRTDDFLKKIGKKMMKR